MIVRAPHHHSFQPKLLPNHPAGVQSKFPTKNPSKSPSQGPSGISDQKSFQITHPGFIRNISGKLHLATRVHTESSTSEKNHPNTQATRLSENHTHRTPFDEPNQPTIHYTHHQYFQSPTPTLSHTWDIPGDLGGHTVHTVIVIKDGSHF